MAGEVVKRLDPLQGTLMDVYLYSGNQCAFPDCTIPMFLDGQYVGELCHIEAAMPEGERFNENMTNEERRHESNLVLMCGTHHRVTDDVFTYPVERMKQLKYDHEKPFRMGFTNMLLQEIRDHSSADILVAAQTVAALNDHFQLGLNAEQALEQVRYWRDFGDILAGVTRHARTLLAIAMKHCHKTNRYWGVTVPELSRRIHEPEERIAELAFELGQSGLAYVAHDPDWYEHNFPMFVIGSKFEDQLKSLQEYANAERIDLNQIIIELRFDLLDNPGEVTKTTRKEDSSTPG